MKNKSTCSSCFFFQEYGVPSGLPCTCHTTNPPENSSKIVDELWKADLVEKIKKLKKPTKGIHDEVCTPIDCVVCDNMTYNESIDDIISLIEEHETKMD